jgi:hypothetical protein
MNAYILFGFGIIISILGWTLVSVSDLKADMKLVKYRLTEIHNSINAKNN